METKEETSQASIKKTAKDQTIVVSVQAEQLYGLAPTEANIDKHTALVDGDGFGSEFGDRNKDFETEVFMNKKITWSIQSDNDLFTCALVSVTHNPTDGNPQFFNRNPIPVRKDGTVQGVIARNPNLTNKDDSYTINFTITFSGVTLPYPLDPKLRISVSQ